MFMTGYIFPKWLLQYLSFNMFILQCNSNSPIKKWDLSFHVCGWTYGYGGSDTLWLLWLVRKGMIQLPASVKMFPVKPSFHAVRKPKSHCGVAPLKRIWHHKMASHMKGPVAVGGEPPVLVKLMLNGEKWLGSTELCSNGRFMSKIHDCCHLNHQVWGVLLVSNGNWSKIIFY